MQTMYHRSADCVNSELLKAPMEAPVEKGPEPEKQAAPKKQTKAKPKAAVSTLKTDKKKPATTTTPRKKAAPKQPGKAKTEGSFSASSRDEAVTPPDTAADAETPSDVSKTPVKRSKGPATPRKKAKKEPMTAELRVPSNWQRKPHASDKTGPMNFENAKMAEDALSITLADGSTLGSGDFVYILSEPIGEPYFIGRIMEFVKLGSDPMPESDSIADNWTANINWLYRPNDLHRKSDNTRELYLTMHYDKCPLQSFRGRCVVKYIKDIKDLNEYMETPSQFWFQKMWDKYILRFFDVVSTSEVHNIPKSALEALRLRFDFIACEPTKTKELLQDARSCKTCGAFATANKAVECSLCSEYYHMACLDPPLAKKPPLGFGWSCALCSFEHATGSSIRNTSNSPGESTEDEEETQKSHHETLKEAGVLALTPAEQRAKKLWPFRYLGMHAKVDEIEDIDARLNPRAASRIGSKHQATVAAWPGRPVIYYRSLPATRKKGRSLKGSRACDPVSSSPAGDLDRSLPWVQEIPTGYIERGGDSTSTLLWSMDAAGVTEEECSSFLAKAEPYAAHIDVKAYSSNFLDACLFAFMNAHGDETRALEEIATLTRKVLKEPTLTPEEVEKFEQAIETYGNELKYVTRYVKTVSSADIVRFYYLWKKTDSGHRIWDDNPNRATRRKVLAKDQADTDLAHAIADDQEPVTGFAADKIKALNKTVSCVYCHASTSREWRRLAGHPPLASETTIEALCIRCARLWYRYAVQWLAPEEVNRLKALKGAQKVFIEPELDQDARAILTERSKYTASGRKRPVQTKKKKAEGEVAADAEAQDTESADQDPKNNTGKKDSGTKKEAATKKAAAKKEVAPPPPSVDRMEAAMIRLTQLPADEAGSYQKPSADYCVVCTSVDPDMAELYCAECGMHVHAACYGWSGPPSNEKWYCDTCVNDFKPVHSTDYYCAICPPRVPCHAAWYAGSTENRRVPDGLKRANISEWVHVRCAVWCKGVGFTDPLKLEKVVTPLSIKKQQARKTEALKKERSSCGLCKYEGGALVECDICHSKTHASCAADAGAEFGFLVPDSVDGGPCRWSGKNVTMYAAVRCASHCKISDSASPSASELKTESERESASAFTSLVPMSTVDSETGMTALQTFANSYCRVSDDVNQPFYVLERVSKLRSVDMGPLNDPMGILVLPQNPQNWTLENTVRKSSTQTQCFTCRRFASSHWYFSETSVCCARCKWHLTVANLEAPADRWLSTKLPKILDYSIQARQLSKALQALNHTKLLADFTFKFLAQQPQPQQLSSILSAYLDRIGGPAVSNFKVSAFAFSQGQHLPQVQHPQVQHSQIQPPQRPQLLQNPQQSRQMSPQNPIPQQHAGAKILPPLTPASFLPAGSNLVHHTVHAGVSDSSNCAEVPSYQQPIDLTIASCPPSGSNERFPQFSGHQISQSDADFRQPLGSGVIDLTASSQPQSSSEQPEQSQPVKMGMTANSVMARQGENTLNLSPQQ